MTAAPQIHIGPQGLVGGRAVRRSLACLLTGEGISYVGSAVHAVGLPALAVLSLEANPGQVALLAFAAEIPALVVALPAGVVVDRYPLRTILFSTDLAAAALVGVIPAAAILDRLSMPLLYAVALALGVLSTLHTAGSMAAVPLLAEPKHLHRANARFTAVITIAGTTGTALGTVLVATIGATRAFAADALSYLVSAWCAARIRALPSHEHAQTGRRPATREIREGVAHSASHPILRPLFQALTVTGIGTGLTATLLSYHLLTTVQIGATGLGVIMAAGSLGGLSGALTAPRLVHRYGTGRVIACAWTVYALMQIPPLVARPGTAWLAILVVSGYGQWAAATCVGTTQRSVQQRTTPPRLRARVQQTSLWLTTGTQPLAALAAGALATVTSVRTVMTAGVIVLLLSAWMLWRSPVRRLTALDGGAQ
ncbi:MULTISPECIES: MFS transporter [Streptomyces]|uniref:MFS transporter n=1 Tax=Streptomyces changanensis TaxID=2964669 RepID=A0ABY5NDA0_9ACTN|nr:MULTISPECIES: MFS transporter [Streptomyces]UUS34017.1 MFS transporter [Streptomyces changanensis]